MKAVLLQGAHSCSIYGVKARAAASTHKKVIVTFFNGETLHGYFNPLRLPNDPLDVLTTTGEHREIAVKEIRAVYFVRDFTEDYEPERKAFLSRPKLDGLWVRLKFRDGDTLEGVVTNDLLALLDSGIQITPPDLSGATVRIFVPRSALSEVTVLGVVGVARRKPQVPASPAQPKLFSE